MSETRTETYAHDCGCELCADHHEDAVRRATPARAEGADAMSDEECAALFDTLAAIRVDSIGYDACHESFVRAARALRRRATPAPEVTVSEAVMSAMEQAVASCADQAAKGMLPGTWCVDYAGILSRSTAALRAATPEVPRG